MLTVLLVLGGGYAAIVGLAYAFQDRLLYFPSRELLATPDRHGLPYEPVRVDTEDGERLHGWWVPAEEPRGSLLFFHGNAGNISDRLESIAQFHRLGLSVLIVDYRGYGKSTGAPSEKGLYRDAEAAWQHLVEARGADPQRTVIFGRSLGAGPAAWLAARQQAGAVILESPFASVPDIAAHHYPWLPARLLATTRFDNRARGTDRSAAPRHPQPGRCGDSLRPRPARLRGGACAERVPRNRGRAQRRLPRHRRPLPPRDRSISARTFRAVEG